MRENVGTLTPRDIESLETTLTSFSEEAVKLAQARISGDESSINGHNQVAAHALAWIGAYVFAIRAAMEWYIRLNQPHQAADLDALLFSIGVGRYLGDLINGIQVGGTERFGFAQLSEQGSTAQLLNNPIVQKLIQQATDTGNQTRLSNLLAELGPGASHGSLGQSEEVDMLRDQYRKFVAAKVTDHISTWHEKDELIPQNVVDELGAMGTFSVTIPEQYGGLGLGVELMCAISEELSRGSLTVGSLATRSEIAAHLLLEGGTDDQKARYLPGIASGSVLPCAVFTEPNSGSDLGSLSTRALKTSGGYELRGNKTWITHAARSDLMFVLARTDSQSKEYEGLSMFIADKQRGTKEQDFPDKGIDGTEIRVLGYRGMKEYELRFDGFKVPARALLGESEGKGFKHLMATFEVARIQTAARGVGVAHSALDLGLKYALQRKQFGKPLISFQRIAGKIANAAAELMVVRQALYAASRLKDQHKRCDMEAGMVKLLAARLAWLIADDALQIHGGNGYALEFPISRVLCDARILSIFEGASEIQAHIVARSMLRKACREHC
ncbi:MAG: acyl-CoA/acyl-ACP dehydrogenase [Hyphomicrobiales bacterium]|nr:acyl-CoA/acyl-ACP dehydrogenase [Hyphomicrobiales bacterium]